MQQQLSTDYNKVAFFAGLCGFLSLIEFAFPKPLPFLRIGFANMAIMISLFTLNFQQTLLLVLVKVLFQAIISGTLFSYVFLFSFCSSFTALFFMMLAKIIFKNHISFVGIGLAGSLGNNLSQIALSYAIIFKQSTSYIAPILLISGLISSIVLGIFTEVFTKNSIWYKNLISNQNFTFPEINENQAKFFRNKFSLKKFCFQSLKDILLFLSIVFFSLLIPSGKVLYEMGFLTITKGALILGLKRSLILILSVELSKLIVPKKIFLKGKIGSFFNLLLIYFRMLSESQEFSKTDFNFKQKKDAKSNLILRLDNKLSKICFNSEEN